MLSCRQWGATDPSKRRKRRPVCCEVPLAICMEWAEAWDKDGSVWGAMSKWVGWRGAALGV